jgi:hypothetical protein
MPSRFAVSHRAGSKFVKRGLRSYFEYRDLGVRRATRGKVVAHVIRARRGKAPHGEWHRHDCRVQFVYVLKGWAVFEYEGVGRVRMVPGIATITLSPLFPLNGAGNSRNIFFGPAG